MPSTTVNTPSEEYSKLSGQWSLPRTLMGGTRAMRAAGKTYLPQEPAESDAAYKCRLERSTLFNAFRKTVKDMTGKVFAKPIVLGDDVPKQLQDYAENIDNAGRNLNVFARDAFFDSLQPGIGFILTEAPPKPTRTDGGVATLADYQAVKWRPYLCFLPAEDVIGWKTATINGVVTVVQVRIREKATVPVDEFSEACITQVRVLSPGRWEIWREAVEGPDKGKWILFEQGTTSLTKIPIAPIYLHRKDFMAGTPPLEDLADLNVAHWQQQSDLRNIAHVVNVPILFGAGFGENEEIIIGANSMTRTTSENAKLAFVTHDGAAIGVTRDLLKDVEFQMQTQGLQLLIPQPGGKTATGEMHDDSKENSPLAMMAGALQDALEWSFGFMAEYLTLGEDKGGSLKVNTDFGISAGAAVDVPNILNAYSNNLIDRETAIDELKRRGFLSDDVDAETVIARAEAEAPKVDAGAGNGMNLDK